MTVRILFVCLGNICRSPLAEAAFRREAEQAGLDVEADSAGTGAWHVGHPPDRRAQVVAGRDGIDISNLRARRVTGADFDRFDHIVALDRDNYDELRRLRPDGARAELSLLLDHVPGREGQPVADPYYGSDADFDLAWDEVTRAARFLARKLARR